MFVVACSFVAASALAATTGDSKSATTAAGAPPVNAKGAPLNFDFESGTLDGWKVEGEAFARQPILGDTVSARRSDMKSGQQGQYWIGTYEIAGDRPEGTLTSERFEVPHRWVSFLVGGGSEDNDTFVEIVAADRDTAIARVGGRNDEELERVAIDLKDDQGKKVFVRIVDHASDGWGHINFDDLRFHAEKPAGVRVVAKGARPTMKPDQYQYDGLSPEDAAKAMTVPENFQVTLFAGEPDIQQPVAMCIDDRGRLWVAEAYVYPQRKTIPGKDREGQPIRVESPGPFVPQGEKGDNIVIFEDTDGDGKHDKRTVFMENLNMVSGLEVGFGGVWIGAAPYLLFVPLSADDDKPAGAPQILLDGWGYQDTHETLNTFIWGPDGWLYGCHGVFTHSRVGKPGTPQADRIPINCGIWRYHPIRHEFEVFCHGTSNPWGLDFNDWGQAFEEACVIPHLFQMIQGARYQRQGGEHFNPYTFEDIKTIADHLHYVGANPHGGNNRSDSAGGGHAHCGTMIYLGGAWPAEYRNQMFMGNIHGRRINMDRLKQAGSGYVASHGPDFLLANDSSARLINLRYGPDGNAYLIDWYDKQACHRPEPEIWDRTNGRIYKISYRGAKPVTNVDLSKKADAELVAMQLSENDWYVRHARRILQERFGDSAASQGGDVRATREGLETIAFSNPDETRRLRGMWALQVTGGMDESQVLKALDDQAPYVRAWAIQLHLERNSKPGELVQKKLVEMAKNDPSPIVRLYLSSAAQKISTDRRWAILAGLLSHAEDADDHNLPCMYWYAAEPLAEVNAKRAFELALQSKVPLVEFMTRRIASLNDPQAMSLIGTQLLKASDAKTQLEMLNGLAADLKGRRNVDEPKTWPAAFKHLQSSKDQEVRDRALSLAVVFGSKDAFDLLRQRLLDAKQPLNQRHAALAALLQARDAQLVGHLQKLIEDQNLSSAALRGLANYNDRKTPEAILQVYGKLGSEAKREAVATLASRVAYAKALVEAVANKTIPATDLNADIVRQIRGFHDKDLDQRIYELWGTVRETAADRKQAMIQYQKMLEQKKDLPADLAHGRMLYSKTCAQCHTLFGVGEKIGPDITGANRPNLDYLLENILDPSAVVPKEYRMTVFSENGRVINGIVKTRNANVVTVQTAIGLVTIQTSDIESENDTSTSLMPEGQLKPLSDNDVRALIAYLQSPGQVPMEATPENAPTLFNGKDLTGWQGDPKLWSVEDGAIVGRSPGLKRNEFLKSQFLVSDFRLTLKVKLTPNQENSGIQFRSEAIEQGEMRGYQADIGKGWWGKLYEENGRGLLWKESGEKYVKEDDWNDYEVVAEGSHIQTFLNGQRCVDFNDPAGARKGIIAMQIHSGGPMEVRFKDLKLEVLSPK
ncbi:MAG: DUF1080 domain-containing protein [Pirellulales bacterium]|nr:DUF1080 domain-containing protein [Pirellulales bacterium]